MEDNRYGTSLLALNTKRQPDRDRGNGIIHLSLTLPAVVEKQVELWEKGKRDPINPREAAGLLWSVEAASYLDGRLEAWLDVPGISLLLPGLKALIAAPLSSWPNSQKSLQEFVMNTRSPHTSTEDFLSELNKMETIDLLNDLVLIFKYAAVGHQRPISTVVDLYRLARTLVATDSAPSKREEIIAWLTAPLVVPKALTAPLGPTGPLPPPSGGAGDDNTTLPTRDPHINFTSPHGAAIIRHLERDIDDIARLNTTTEMVHKLREAGVSDPKVMANIIKDGNNKSDEIKKGTRLVRQLKSQPSSEKSKLISVNIAGSPVLINLSEVNNRRARRRNDKTKKLAKLLPQDIQDRVQDLNLIYEGEWNWPDILGDIEPLPSYLEPVGRTDLLLVRQVTTGYRRAEIAYIENVLIGETREREHSSRILTREELFEIIERETEETSDLQVTDRSELSREVNKVVAEDLQTEGSVKVTSRGPTKVVASASVSFERSTEETSKTAEEYARETIERASKRILERTKHEARSLFEQEVVEDNRHNFERASSEEEHVSGVYQYLERVSRAKIFSYGERELYDILVPEPAALIWELSISTKELSTQFQEPDEVLFNSLTLKNIAEEREEVIKAFRVVDLEPLPRDTRNESMSFSRTGGGKNAKFATNKELQIPDGYVVTGASFTVSAEIEESDNPKPNGGIAVGPDIQLWHMSELTNNAGTIVKPFTFLQSLPGPTVSVAINAENFQGIAGSVTLDLKLTDEKRHEWALEAYSRVAERFEQMRREYEQGLIQAEATQPTEEVTLPVGSRRRLEQIIRFELQRAAIGIMRNVPVNFDLINENYGSEEYPALDFPALGEAEPVIRFLQQAFEWEHLSWVLYPYFWGRRSEWNRSVVQTHPDPDFSAFLNAGAARLQISVRPGFEGFVKHFMETGEAYEGDGLPRMGDPGYLPFIDEQITSLGGPGEEVPWPVDQPREWDVVTPTPLVLVRKNAETQLPTWDPETGDEL